MLTLINFYSMELKMKSLLTTKELAEYLNIHPVSLNRKVLKGDIPFYQLSKTNLRFDLDEVLTKLKEGAK